MARIPHGCADIDAAWLNEVLDPQVRDSASVVAVDTQIIGEGVGFLGEVARLTLTYDDTACQGVRTLIAKLPTTNEGFKHIGLMLGFYAKESGFYREVAPEVTISIPAAYHNGADHDAGDYVLLLEDMAPRRPGNQLESCTFDEAEQALRAIAAFHAHWWEHPRLAEFESWLPGPDGPYFAILEQAYLGALPQFPDVFGHLMTQDVLDLAQRTAAAYGHMVERGVGRRPHTFIHGDFRLDNMMFGGDDADGGFTLLDWQLPFRANPMWDVVYFLAGNFEPEWRRTHQRDLIGTYHDGLIAHGIADYPLEQCWEDYRAAGLVLLGYLVTGAADVDLATLNARGLELVETMYSRYATAIIDLDSASFLD